MFGGLLFLLVGIDVGLDEISIVCDHVSRHAHAHEFLQQDRIDVVHGTGGRQWHILLRDDGLWRAAALIGIALVPVQEASQPPQS